MHCLLKVVILLGVTVGIVGASVPPAYRLLGSLKIAQPAFANPAYLGKDSTSFGLIVTSFSAIPFFGTDYVFYLPNVASDLSKWNKSTIVQLTTQINWPNEGTAVPFEYFGRPVVAVAGGFLVPGKWTGAITLILTDTNPVTTVKISTDKSEWFYHQVTWKDMNGDGLQDVLTARAIQPLFGTSQGELLWLEQPSSKPFSNPWVQHVLTPGPEFFFQLLDIDGDGNEELLATEFFGAALVLFWNWQDPSTIQSRVIDKSIGPTFDLVFFDLNNDGKLEVLVTNHVNNATLSGVYAYEIPTDFKKGNWIRHDIATGFPTRISGVGQASPGKAIPLFPNANLAGKEKPLILLGGDGTKDAYLITPNSQNPKDWSYTVTTFLQGGGTVGQVTAGDADGDGWTEFFVPMYDDGLLWAYTFAPQK